MALVLKTTNNPDMRRYERPHINEVWCGDSSVDPYLKTEDGKKHKVYIIVLIDDASRLIVGIDIIFNDNFINLMLVMKSAIAKYGHPQLFNFDNGKSYKNNKYHLLANVKWEEKIKKRDFEMELLNERNDRLVINYVGEFGG